MQQFLPILIKANSAERLAQRFSVLAPNFRSWCVNKIALSLCQRKHVMLSLQGMSTWLVCHSFSGKQIENTCSNLVLKILKKYPKISQTNLFLHVAFNICIVSSLRLCSIFHSIVYWKNISASTNKKTIHNTCRRSGAQMPYWFLQWPKTFLSTYNVRHLSLLEVLCADVDIIWGISHLGYF